MNLISSVWQAIIDTLMLSTSYLAISTWFLVISLLMLYRYLKNFR